jgi:hypothetical protein
MSERTKLSPVEGLQRIPGPPARRPVPGRESDNSVAAVAAPEPAPRPAPAPAAATPSQSKRPKASDASTGGMRQIAFTAPVELATQLSEAARRDPDLTVAAIIVQSVEAAVDSLSEYVRREQLASEPTRPSGTSLFPDAASGARLSAEPRTTVTFRMSEANVRVLDKLTKAHNADSRSQLLTAALRARFTARSAT